MSMLLWNLVVRRCLLDPATPSSGAGDGELHTSCVERTKSSISMSVMRSRAFFVAERRPLFL
jgi:hypothetical protein